MGVQDGRALLGKSLKELMARWGDTKSQWNDIMSRNFEKNRLQALEMDMRGATQAMDSMAQLLSQIRRDCQ
jgi:hypothetical protein